MLGRGVAPIADADPDGLFEEVRHVLSAADIAGGNLESPLTLRPHIATNPNDLTADPAYADLLANAGFDVMSVANNHSGDAGRGSVADTVDAVEAAGMAAVGGGDDLMEAFSPEIIDHSGVRVAFLAFDATLARDEATYVYEKPTGMAPQSNLPSSRHVGSPTSSWSRSTGASSTCPTPTRSWQGWPRVLPSGVQTWCGGMVHM